MQYKIGFIGTGVMAGAILDRFLTSIGDFSISINEIAVFDLDTNKTQKYKDQGVSVLSSTDEILANCQITVLGVKPQFYADILKNTTKINSETILSIMAGVKINTLRSYLGEKIGVVRVMPNTPCTIGKGVMAVCFDNVIDDTEQFITNVLNTCGKTIIISEDKFDAVTSISGSGPAYVYMFADAMVKAGINGGLTEEESKQLALKTIEGSALYASMAEFDLGTLVERVCSKGGTTIEAVNVFNDLDLYGIVDKAIEACRKKSEYLSEKL